MSPYDHLQAAIACIALRTGRMFFRHHHFFLPVLRFAEQRPRRPPARPVSIEANDGPVGDQAARDPRLP